MELGYVENTFEEVDLERAINNANNFFPDKNHRIENVIQKLLNAYIENPPSDKYKYILTPHANRFIEFLGKKLFNEHTHFPLRKTFQDYGLFKADRINGVRDFESWFEFHFKKMWSQFKDDVFKEIVIILKNDIHEMNNTFGIEAAREAMPR